MHKIPAGDLLGAHGGGATGWSRTETSEPPAPPRLKGKVVIIVEVMCGYHRKRVKMELSLRAIMV